MTIEFLTGMVCAIGLLMSYQFFVISNLSSALQLAEEKLGLQERMIDILGETMKHQSKVNKGLVQGENKNNELFRLMNERMKLMDGQIVRTSDLFIELTKTMEVLHGKPINVSPLQTTKH